MLEKILRNHLEYFPLFTTQYFQWWLMSEEKCFDDWGKLLSVYCEELSVSKLWDCYRPGCEERTVWTVRHPLPGCGVLDFSLTPPTLPQSDSNNTQSYHFPPLHWWRWWWFSQSCWLIILMILWPSPRCPVESSQCMECTVQPGDCTEQCCPGWDSSGGLCYQFTSMCNYCCYYYRWHVNSKLSSNSPAPSFYSTQVQVSHNAKLTVSPGSRPAADPRREKPSTDCTGQWWIWWDQPSQLWGLSGTFNTSDATDRVNCHSHTSHTSGISGAKLWRGARPSPSTPSRQGPTRGRGRTPWSRSSTQTPAVRLSRPPRSRRALLWTWRSGPSHRGRSFSQCRSISLSPPAPPPPPPPPPPPCQKHPPNQNSQWLLSSKKKFWTTKKILILKVI